MKRLNLIERKARAALPLAGLFALLATASEAGVGFRTAVHDFDGSYEVELWTDRGEDAVYDDGEFVHVRFRPERSAYVVVYGIDVEGELHLLYPTHRDDPRYCRAGTVYDVDHELLRVEGLDGIVYLQAVACAYPLEPYFPNCFRRHARPIHSPVGYGSGYAAELGIVIGDPYLALAEIRGWLLPRGCEPQHFGFATVSYSCRSPRLYPRYLCADCHYGSWYDPYHDACSVFEIRVDTWWNEPRHAYSCQPRYHYWKRASAPEKYRSWKTKWSSKDRRFIDKDASLASAFGGKTRRDVEYLEAHEADRPKPTLGRGDGERDLREKERGTSTRGVKAGKATVRGRDSEPEKERARVRERESDPAKDRERVRQREPERKDDRDRSVKPAEKKRDPGSRSGGREKQAPKRDDGGRGKGDGKRRGR